MIRVLLLLFVWLYVVFRRHIVRSPRILAISLNDISVSYSQNNEHFKSTQEKEYSRLANAHLDLERQAPRGCSKEAEPSSTPAETSGSPHPSGPLVLSRLQTLTQPGMEG